MVGVEFNNGWVIDYYGNPGSYQGKSFAGFLRAVQKGDLHAIEKQGSCRVISKGNDELSGGGGGYLVPREYTTRFLVPLAERSLVYPRATIIPMGTLEMVGPMLDATTVQSANIAPFFGGIVAKWGSQANTYVLSESEPQFREQTLHAWDLLLYAVASNQLLQDTSPEGDEKLLENFGKAAAWYADHAFFNGLGAGTSMPLGMLNAPCAIDVARAGANGITIADVAKMTAKMIPIGWENAVWACSPAALEKVTQITGFQANMDHNGPAGCAGYLMSRPLFVSSKLPTLGVRGDLVFFDPSLYLVGDRMQVTIDVSEHAPISGGSMFAQNRSMFKVWLRMDGKPILNNFVTITDSASNAMTVSSVVVLANAA